MGFFGKKNNCPFKDRCSIAGVDGTCSYCASENYRDCDLHQDWSGGGINSGNTCPLKDSCPDYPYSCLYGKDPESCFRYQMKKPPTTFSWDDSDDDDATDAEPNFDSLFGQATAAAPSRANSRPKEESKATVIEESEEVKQARKEAELERIKQKREREAAEHQAELERIERERKREAEREAERQKELEREKQREAEREALKQKALETAEELLSEKNYKMAAILAIVLGSLGAHKFYMGKYKMGILYLVFCWTWIPGIIGVIEGLVYLIQGPEKFEERLQ